MEYDTLTQEVLRHFPDSKWNRSHWLYWRRQLVLEKDKHNITESEIQNLYPPANKLPSSQSTQGISKPPHTRPIPEDKVKRIGDELLQHVRFVLDELCGDEADLRFKVNRWVFSRLLLDERKAKKPFKDQLWNTGPKLCGACGQAFSSLKGVELHRVDRHKNYSESNCILLCGPCHRKVRD